MYKNVLLAYKELEEVYRKSVNYANIVVLSSGTILNIVDSLNIEDDLNYYYQKELIIQSQNNGRATFLSRDMIL